MKYLICLVALLWAGMKLTAADNVKEVEIKIIETSDVHGNFFPYNFIERPKPVPCEYSFNFSNRSKILSLLPAGIPHPVSVTENSRQLSSLFTFIAKRIKPEGVNLPAFERRLINTCFNRCASVFNINEDTGV